MVSSKPTSETRSSKLKSNPEVERDARVHHIARTKAACASAMPRSSPSRTRAFCATSYATTGLFHWPGHLHTTRGMAASAAPAQRTSCRAAVAAVHSTAVAASPPLQRMMTRRRSQFPIARGKLRSCAVPALPTPNIADMIERNALARSRRRLQAAARPLTHQLRCCLCSCGSESALAPLDGPVEYIYSRFQISDFRIRSPAPDLHIKIMDTQEKELTFLDFDHRHRLRNCSRRNRQALKSVESRNKPFQNTSISWFRSSPSKSTLESLHSETTIVPSFCFEIDKIH